ncbi:MAG: NDP-sugar synthase [Elusimicrobiota bacterium]
MNAVLLAAGKGERLGVYTRKTPKPMLRIGGKPILEHNVEWCRDNGFTRLFINLHHRPDVIIKHFGDGSRFGVSIAYKRERSLLGTSGAVKNFADKLDGEPFLVVYGDNWVDYDLAAMMARHRRSGADMSVAVFRLADARLSGLVTMNRAGRILSFVEKPQSKKPVPGWVNAAVYVMNPALLDEIPRGFSDFGRDVIPRLLKEGRLVQGIRMPHKVKAVDTPALYRKWAPTGIL